ncbi:MAG: hypothetical protein ACI97A_001112 [Planctomycetota bacterium]|jgi:hypothetical protein
MSNDPEISVVVAGYCGEQTLRRCLERLHQHDRPGVEYIVPVTLQNTALNRLRTEFPDVNFLPSEESPTTDPRLIETRVFRLRSMGAREARGRLVVLTEDHIVTGPDWLDAFVGGHEQEHRVVGGPVDPGDDASIYTWALYLCEYVQLIRPMVTGPAAYVSGVNACYRKTSLDRCRDAWRDSFFENEVNDALMADGHTLWMESGAWIQSELLFPFKKARSHLHTGGWRFGCYRREGSTGAELWKWRVTLPLVPVFHFWRILKVMMVRRPKNLIKLVLGLPVVLTLVLSWSLGEARGLFGRGHTADFFPKS